LGHRCLFRHKKSYRSLPAVRDKSKSYHIGHERSNRRRSGSRVMPGGSPPHTPGPTKRQARPPKYCGIWTPGDLTWRRRQSQSRSSTVTRQRGRRQRQSVRSAPKGRTGIHQARRENLLLQKRC